MFPSDTSVCTSTVTQPEGTLTYEDLRQAWQKMINDPALVAWEESFNKEFALPYGFDMSEPDVRIITGCKEMPGVTPPHWRSHVLYSPLMKETEVVLYRGTVSLTDLNIAYSIDTPTT